MPDQMRAQAWVVPDTAYFDNGDWRDSVWVTMVGTHRDTTIARFPAPPPRQMSLQTAVALQVVLVVLGAAALMLVLRRPR